MTRVNILGVEISAVSLEQAIPELARWIKNGERHYVNLCTVHTVMECRRSKKLQRMVNNSGMAAPDGMPLVWLCRHFGENGTTRVYGPDLLLAFCEYSVSPGYRHFFYGGAPGAAEELVEEMKRRFPGLETAGFHSPGILPVGGMESPDVIEEINAARADVVWVGLGTPKQDHWVANHRQLLQAPVLVAVGAAFDFLTGRMTQAPRSIQRCGLEWLFRLAHEPGRLWFRYLVYNPAFLFLVALQIAGLRPGR